MSVTSSSSRHANSRTRRLLPIPGAPSSVTSSGERWLRRRASASWRRATSFALPTSGASRCTVGRAGPRAATTSHAGTGSAFPFARTGSTSRYSIVSRVARYVASPTRMPSTGAADWSRAQVLTTSPAAIHSPPSGRAWSATAATPLFTPIRMCSSLPMSAAFSSSTRDRTARAARTARSGSSSWATGAPKIATTASPMNFSTVPPYRSSSTRRFSNTVPRNARTSSGSSCSASSVEPTTSAKRTLTKRRSSLGPRCSPVSAVPHVGQKAKRSSTGDPQDSHTVPSGEPQPAQKRAPSSFSNPHAAQLILGGW